MAVQLNSPRKPADETPEPVADPLADSAAASAPSTEPETPSDPHALPPFRIPQPLAIGIALVMGLGIGGFLVHKHDTAQVPVAVVNGYIINKEHFFNRMQEAGGAATLRQMVIEELQLEYAKKRGALPTPEEVDARFAEMQQDPQMRAQMAASGQSEPALKRALEIQMAQTKVASRGVTVTDADIQKYYRANIDHNNPAAQFYTPETVTISLIESKSAADIQEANSQLQRLYPFETVARRYSQDATRDAGGHLPGPVERGRTKLSTVPGMEDAIFSLKVGEQLGPQQFAGAWWIIRCDDKSPAITLPFDKVRQQCVDGALVTKGLPRNSKQIQTDFETFQKNSKVRAIWPQYADDLAFNQPGK